MNGAKIVLKALKVGFTLTVAQFQAVILVALCIYWLFTRWDAIVERFSPENLGPTMFGVIFTFGLFVGTLFFMDWGSEYALLAAMLACSLILAMCDPAISICVFINMMFMRPWELITDNEYFLILPKLTMSLCIMNVLIDMVRKRRFSMPWNQTATNLMAFALWLLLTTFKTGADGQSFFFDTMFKNCFLFVIMLNLVREKAELDLVVWTIVITMFGVGLASIYQTLDYREQILLTGAMDANADPIRLVGFGAFENANDIAALLVLVMPFYFVPAIRKGTNWLPRLIGITGLGIVGVCLAMAMSRGAQLGIVAIVALYSFLNMKSRKNAIIVGVICLLGVLGASSLSARNEADLDESKRFRTIYLQTGLVMGATNPLMGVGFNGYAPNFTTYQTGEVDGTLDRTAHNSWVLTFSESGVPGIILFVLIFASALMAAWTIRVERPEFLLALVGYGIAMTFLSHSYLLYPYLIYALSSIAQMAYGAEKVAQRSDKTAELRPSSKLLLGPAPDPVPQS